MYMDAIDLPLPPAGTRIGADEVYSTLIEAISIGRLRAGERLPSEEALAAHFNIAAMTLRQALARLRTAGYVVTSRGRHGGTRVVPDIAERLEADALRQRVTLGELRILTDWRRAVSGEASSLAALRGTEAERVDLRRLEQEYLTVIESTTDRRFADARLHIHIAQMSGNPRLVQAEQEIQEQLTRFIRVTSLPEVKAAHEDMDHSRLLEAILSADPESARAALQHHVEVTYFWGTMQPHIVGGSHGAAVLRIEPGALEAGVARRPDPDAAASGS